VAREVSGPDGRRVTVWADDRSQADIPGGLLGEKTSPTDDLTAARRRREDAEDAAAARARPSAATLLVGLALAAYELGRTPGGDAYAVPREGPRLPRVLRGSASSLRADLAARYYREHGGVAAQQALGDAIGVLDGMAATLGADLHLRVARGADGGPLLDLGDDTGRAVRITPAGWQVLAPDDHGVLWRRTALTGRLPDPEPGGDLGELWALLNVAAADQPMMLAWLLGVLLVGGPTPVLALVGEQGTGKSTAARTVVELLDPGPAPLRKAPRDVESWVTAAQGSQVVGLDNLSGLPDWLSDALCRSVTGDGDVRRRLYSDGDLTVFAYRRAVVVNGIDLGAVRDDLADRLLTIGLERITDTDRRLDADLAARWAQAHPRVLAALLDLAVRVLAALPNVRVERLPRMADYARVLAAVDLVLGTDGTGRYAAARDDLAADAVTGDPVLAALADAIRSPWTGTASDLLGALAVPDPRPRDWPKDARALTGVLTRRAPSLRRLGWTVADLGRGGKDKLKRWRVVPPTAATEGAGDGGHQAGIRRASAAPDDPTPAATPVRQGAVTCDDTLEPDITDGRAGVAGIEYPPSLSAPKRKEEGGAPDGVGAHPTPAMPAMPAEPLCATCAGPVRPTTRSLALGLPTVRATCEPYQAKHHAGPVVRPSLPAEPQR